MMNTATCNTCSHFDANHEMCLAMAISTHVGLSFATRTSESPACWEGYCRKTEPGEISDLFEQNRILSPAMSSNTMRAQKLFGI